MSAAHFYRSEFGDAIEGGFDVFRKQLRGITRHELEHAEADPAR
jgi:hypothetical protein